MSKTRRSSSDKPEGDGLVHVLDLPQLYQKPSTKDIVQALNLLAALPRSFGSAVNQRTCVSSEGVPEYLTRIVASPLTWIGSEADQERIWGLASQRLAERSGRTGMGAIDREFGVSLPGSELQELRLQIHEPALTEDNLGLKTWGSSFTLAKELPSLKEHFGHLSEVHARTDHLPVIDHAQPKILELGAGTGVLGLAFAAVFGTWVLMTDLPNIASNLKQNAEANASALSRVRGARASVGILDWSQPALVRSVGSEGEVDNGSDGLHFDTIIAADPIYSALHPAMLTDAINARLCRVSHAKVLVAYPLRVEYQAQTDELSELLHQKCQLTLLTSARVQGEDDWDEVTVEYKLFACRL